jgi:fatty-acyl-CoA synthase
MVVAAPPSLAALIHAGLAGTTLRFGTGEPVGAGRLADDGARWFSPEASAPLVAAVLTNDRPSVELLLGAITAGATLVSVPLPGRGADLDDYATFVRDICDLHQVEELVVRDDLVALAEGAGLPARGHATLGRSGRPVAAPNADGRFRLVQFSSGSTRQARPVQLDDQQLGANVAALLDALRPQPGDRAVSWLPLSHDMGLVGMVLTSIAGIGPDWAGRGAVILFDPADFVRRPGLWVDALDEHRATFTAAPNFGYRLAVLRRPRRTLDLSPLRCAIVGGEIVRADTLAEFAGTFAGDGLAATALCPAYGLAELGLGVTMTRPDEHWHEHTADTTALAGGRLDPPEPGRPATTLVASGRPLTGYRITAGEGDRSGPLSVTGPSVGVDGRTGDSFAGDDGWVRTGDTGFVDGDGRLYACGRVDDFVVTHGRNVYAPAVEARLGQLDGVRQGRAAVVSLPTGEWVVVAEATGAVEPARLREDLRRTAVLVAEASPDDVVLAGRGSLPHTPSGKLRRRELRDRLLRGEL